MDMEKHLHQLRLEDRAASRDMAADLRGGVLARIRAARRSPVGSFLENWLVLLHQPRWAVALAAVAVTVTLTTTWTAGGRSEAARFRAVSSLDTFQPLAPYTPERVLSLPR
jgi:hypothetical protein